MNATGFSQNREKRLRCRRERERIRRADEAAEQRIEANPLPTGAELIMVRLL